MNILPSVFASSQQSDLSYSLGPKDDAISVPSTQNLKIKIWVRCRSQGLLSLVQYTAWEIVKQQVR